MLLSKRTDKERLVAQRIKVRVVASQSHTRLVAQEPGLESHATADLT